MKVKKVRYILMLTHRKVRHHRFVTSAFFPHISYLLDKCFINLNQPWIILVLLFVLFTKGTYYR